MKEREMKVNDIGSIFDNIDEGEETNFRYSLPHHVEESLSFFITHLQKILKKFKDKAID